MTVIATNPYGFYTKANALTDKTFSAIFLSSDKHCKVIKSSAGNKKNPTNTSYCKKKTFKKCTNKTAETDKKNITTESQCDEKSVFSCKRCKEQPRRRDELL